MLTPPDLPVPHVLYVSLSVTSFAAWPGHDSALWEPRSARGTELSLLQLCIPEMERAAQARAAL